MASSLFDVSKQYIIQNNDLTPLINEIIENYSVNKNHYDVVISLLKKRRSNLFPDLFKHPKFTTLSDGFKLFQDNCHVLNET